MVKLIFPSCLSRVKKLLAVPRRHRSQGFTLLELMVVVGISSLIVAGLTFIVMQLTNADQRESSRSETQREMQMALEYISTELREAVYIYTGDNLQCPRRTSPTDCGTARFTDYLPTSLSDNSVPVLAFWKQQPFPQTIKDRCANGTATAPTTEDPIACLAGSSYALVVYSLKVNPDNDTRWKGKARITRYVLSEFDSNGDRNVDEGYVNPGQNNNFTTWPFGVNNNGATTNLQLVRPPSGDSVTLVDFVDATASNTGASTTSNLTSEDGRTVQAGACPIGYSESPTDAALTGSFADVRSFYACISVRPTNNNVQDTGDYQDVILYLRGNAEGRAGVPRRSLSTTAYDAEALPTLETRVLGRGVLNRQPAQ